MEPCLLAHAPCLPSFFFFFKCSAPPRALHSFPTRRSSDLRGLIFPASEIYGGIANTYDYSHYGVDRKSTRLNSSHPSISYAVFCLKKKKIAEPAAIHAPPRATADRRDPPPRRVTPMATLRF